MKKHILFILFLASGAFFSASAGEPPKSNWSVKKPFDQRVFIENKGQFSAENKLKEQDILFGGREGNLHYFFTRTGLTVMNYARVKRSEKEIEELMEKLNIREDKKSKGEGEKEFGVKMFPEFHQLEWKNANPNAQVIAEDKTSDYYSYPDVKRPKENINIRAAAFKKITYKNLYPNIDVEFYFPQDKEGYKYNIILHPGADASQIEMLYAGQKLAINSNKDLEIQSPLGLFTDHAPSAQTASGKKLDCSFVIKKNSVFFSLPFNKITEETVIDPWTTNPLMIVWNKGYDVDFNNAGEVYVSGGSYPYQIKKYSPGGVLVWTFSCASFTPYSGTDAFYGDFAVDRNSGSAYATEGFNFSGAKVIKINNAGVNTANYGGTGLFTEMWRMAFSRCTNQAVIVGGGISSPTYHGCYLDTNLINLVPVTLNGTGQTGDDIALLALDNLGGGYFLASSFGGMGALSDKLCKMTLPGLLPIQYMVTAGYNIVELSSYFVQPQPSGLSGYAIGNGINGLTTSNSNVYSYDSYVLKKWNGPNGANLGYKRVNFPANNDSSKIYYSGITADDCDHVFVGSKNQVKQYDQNLNLVNTIAMTDTVCDVMLGRNGILYATGRGFVSATLVNIPSCQLLNTVNQITNGSCANPIGSATITVTGGTAPYTINWNTTPVQTGSVITGVTTGTYVATITDNSCPPVTAYDTVVITTNGGVNAVSAITNVNCFGGVNGAITLTVTPTGTIVPTYTWSTGANTQNISNVPAGVYTLTIGTGGPCNMTLTYTVTQPPQLSYTVSPGTIGCFGDTTSISVAVSGGTPYVTGPKYSVQWGPPAATGFAVHGLGAGNYGGTITDTMGCVATYTTVLTQPLPIAMGYSFTVGCLGSPVQFTDQSTGGPFTYSWNYGDGTAFGAIQNPQHIYASAGTYTTSLIVINSNNCKDTLQQVLTVDPPPQAAFIGDTLAGCPVHDVVYTDQSTCTSGTIINWLWDFGNGLTSVSQFPTAVYYNNTSATINANYNITLTVVSSKGCTSKVVKNNYVTVYPHPQAGFYYSSDDGSQIDVLNNNVHFYSTAVGASIYNWNLGDIFANPFSTNYTPLVNPTHQYKSDDAYTYYVTQEVENQYGCKDSVTLPLSVKPVYTFYIPNSFSPNGDGVNEEFKGQGYGINNNTFKMVIFDRWGNLIFTSNDINKGWDGRPFGKGDVAIEDTYVWKVNFVDILGLKHEYHGIVSVVK